MLPFPACPSSSFLSPYTSHPRGSANTRRLRSLALSLPLPPGLYGLLLWSKGDTPARGASLQSTVRPTLKPPTQVSRPSTKSHPIYLLSPPQPLAWLVWCSWHSRAPGRCSVNGCRVNKLRAAEGSFQGTSWVCLPPRPSLSWGHYITGHRSNSVPSKPHVPKVA